MPLQPGTRLGPYEITAAIGAGGMGEVYQARDTALNRDVAIKVLPDTLADDPDHLARFQRDATIKDVSRAKSYQAVRHAANRGGVAFQRLVDAADGRP